MLPALHFRIPPAELKAMFDMLDAELPVQGCDRYASIDKSCLEVTGYDVDD